MPLVWAHAEYAKLVRSLHDGRVFDMPQQTYERYVRARRVAELAVWAPHNRWRILRAGVGLRIQTTALATVTWTVSDGTTQREAITRDTTLAEVWIADIPTAALAVGAVIRFAIRVADGTIDGVHEITVV